MAYSPRNRNQNECIAFLKDDNGNFTGKCTNPATKSAPDDNSGDGDRKIYCQAHYDNLTTDNEEIFTCSHFGAPNPMNPSKPFRRIGQIPNCSQPIEKCKYDSGSNTYDCENTNQVFVGKVDTISGRGGFKTPTIGSRASTGSSISSPSTKSPTSSSAKTPGTPTAPTPSRKFTTGVAGAYVPAFEVPDLDPGNYRECNKSKGAGNIKYSNKDLKPTSPKSKPGAYRIDPNYVRSCELPIIEFDERLVQSLRIIDTTSNYTTLKSNLNYVVTAIRGSNFNIATQEAYNFDVEEEVANDVAAYLHDFMDNGYRIELLLSWLFNYESRDLDMSYSFFGIKGTSSTLSGDVKNKDKVKAIGNKIPEDVFTSKNQLYVKILETHNEGQGVWYGLADYYMEKKKVSSTSGDSGSGKRTKEQQITYMDDTQRFFQGELNKLKEYQKKNGTFEGNNLEVLRRMQKIVENLGKKENPFQVKPEEYLKEYEKTLKGQIEKIIGEKPSEIPTELTKTVSDVTDAPPKPSGGSGLSKNFKNKFKGTNLYTGFDKLTSEQKTKFVENVNKQTKDDMLEYAAKILYTLDKNNDSIKDNLDNMINAISTNNKVDNKKLTNLPTSNQGQGGGRGHSQSPKKSAREAAASGTPGARRGSPVAAAPKIGGRGEKS